MKLLITSALLVLAISPFAQANHDLSYHNRGEHSSNVFKARVIDSTPIYKYVTVSQPQTYCQPVVVNKTHRYSHDRGAATVGGIVGGVIGHAASDHKHKGLGTILGAVIGLTTNTPLATKLNNKTVWLHTKKPVKCEYWMDTQ
jgi:uncharacterized protein YcfJ